MDSVTALHDACADPELGVVAGLSFHYGSKHNDCEIPLARNHCEQLGIAHHEIDLGFVDKHFQSALLQSGGEIPDGHYEESNMQQTVVPFRNGIMLSIAAGVAESNGASALVIAAHSGDHAIYPDCREEFMAAMSDAIRLGTYESLDVLRPFIDLRKEDIVTRAVELGVDLGTTWSCYKGGDTHCGTCGTCVERREAFQIAGVADPTDYLNSGPLPAKPETE